MVLKEKITEIIAVLGLMLGIINVVSNCSNNSELNKLSRLAAQPAWMLTTRFGFGGNISWHLVTSQSAGKIGWFRVLLREKEVKNHVQLALGLPGSSGVFEYTNPLQGSVLDKGISSVLLKWPKDSYIAKNYHEAIPLVEMQICYCSVLYPEDCWISSSKTSAPIVAKQCGSYGYDHFPSN